MKALPLLAVVLLAATGVDAAIPPEIHKLCKDAKDYQGCVQAQTVGGPLPSATEEECWKNYEGSRRCIAGFGNDRFGMPKKEGWIYWTNYNGSIWYAEWDVKKRNSAGNPASVTYQVPHEGQIRYIATRNLFRWHEPPTAGTPGYATTLGSERTTCYGYGPNVNCTTTPATKFVVPGREGTPGGVMTRETFYVVDCKEYTTAVYVDGKAAKGWIKREKDSPYVSNCIDINSYPVLNLAL